MCVGLTTLPPSYADCLEIWEPQPPGTLKACPCATSRKIEGLIPDGVIWIFHWRNPSGRTMTLGVDSASNRNEYQEYFPGVKAAGAYCWQPYHLHVPIVLKSGSLSLLKPSGPVPALQAGRSRVWFPMVSFEFFIDIILPAALWPWGSTQPLTEMSTRNISWG